MQLTHCHASCSFFNSEEYISFYVETFNFVVIFDDASNVVCSDKSLWPHSLTEAGQLAVKKD